MFKNDEVTEDFLYVPNKKPESSICFPVSLLMKNHLTTALAHEQPGKPAHGRKQNQTGESRILRLAKGKLETLRQKNLTQPLSPPLLLIN